jgi:hypothetical protein
MDESSFVEEVIVDRNFLAEHGSLAVVDDDGDFELDTQADSAAFLPVWFSNYDNPSSEQISELRTQNEMIRGMVWRYA